MPSRRAGAPRLIEWTGERCVPWAPNVQVIYEHYHRYLWAQALVSGQRVLDVGSGEGFGSALLADRAREVVGIDIDERTVEHSQLNWAAPGLEFHVASATDMSAFEDDSFDAVVAFEVIEHVLEQEQVLAEVARVLTPGGLLIVSTPDRHVYSDTTGQENPFHERELTEAELRALLSRHFGSLELFGQRPATGSRIETLATRPDDRHLGVQIERSGDEWVIEGPPSPIYLIAVASTGPLPELPSSSTLSDYGLGLVREAQAEHARTLNELAEAREAAQRSAAETRELGAQLIARTRELDERPVVSGPPGPEGSVLWEMLQTARSKFYGRIGGRDSRTGKAVGATLRRVGRKREGRARRRPRWGSLRLPEFRNPDVSIVIPVHNGAGLTDRCLRAILHSSDGVAYEVVIVDDLADAETKALLAALSGVRVIANDENLGYLRSVNRGVAAARGRHVVLLNNDTEPQPGWLSAMVERAESADDIGVVTAKLLFPDGRLQEAGGIVWREGIPWNFGRGEDPANPEYNYVRDVDYGSAAALLVRADVWRAVGGFDERFVPGYFEDTDLCFAARAHGWRVVFEPNAVVVHVEGGAMGTDETAGLKRHQQLNQPKFAEKWRDALRDQPGDPAWKRAHMASDRRREPCVLVVDHRVPTPDRDSGSLRMWRMLEGFVELGCRVSFLPDDANAPEPYTSRLQGMGVEVLAGQVVVPERVAGFGRRLTLGILSRPYVAARYQHLIREFAPSALVAYDTVDLHFLREERRTQHDTETSPKLAEGYRELELALARVADVTLVVSGQEREHLAAAAPDIRIEVVPNANDIATEVRGPEERSGLLFVGGFEHVPNIDAAHYMAHEVMPRVWRSIPDATLTIVGSHAPSEVVALESEGIQVPGWVEDLTPLLNAHLAMVAPLRFGAGMKGKVTQSLGAGLPVVTTSIGAEGLSVVDGRELLIADDPDGFAERVLRLHREPETWRKLSESGRELARQVCSPEVQLKALRRLLASAPAGEKPDQERSATKVSWSPAPR
jgi:O-antigen biosynthesis protein